MIINYTIILTDSSTHFFFRCYQQEILLSECPMLKIRMMDYKTIKNKFIGETVIDIRSRYYSKHRARCGLPKQYDE